MDNQVKFHGRGREFFGIWIVNLLLSMVTLGIYSAWAKVRTNKYFYGNTELAGDRFDYHAEPTQILKGRIVAILCVLVWFVASEFFPLVAAILMLAFLGVMPLLIRNNTRFDARMSSYRHVRFDFVGTLKGAYGVFLGWPAMSYLLLFLCLFFTSAVFGTYPVVGVVFGLLTFILGFVLYAWVSARMSEYFANGYRYGNRTFSAELDLKAYLKINVMGGLIGIALSAVALFIGGMLGGAALIAQVSNPALVGGELSAVLGIWMFAAYACSILIFLAVSAFVKARVRNYLFSQIKVDGEPEYGFSSTMTTFGLVALMVTNFLLMVVTIGFARPWVMVRSTRYVTEMTTVKGDLSLLVVEGDDVEKTSAIADEVANAFDLNMGIG